MSPATEMVDDPSAGAVSLGERAYADVRERIATRQLVPGQRLTERALAASLKMSPTPVREALRRLEQQGLIAKLGARTVVVAEHSPETLWEVQYAQLVLRAAAARFAAGKAVPGQVASLRRSVSELEEAARGGAAADVLAAAGRFDDLVAVIADNPMVAALVRSAEVVGRGRRLQAVEAMMQHRRPLGRRHLRAHRDLVDAIAAHDGDRAEEVVRVHLRSSLDLLLSDLEGAG